MLQRISPILLAILLFASHVAAEELAPRATERTDFEIALKSKAVKALSQFIKTHPESELVPDAVMEIWEVLLTKFPSDKYRSSTSLESLKTGLPTAIKANRAFLVTFAPKSVAGSGLWSWTTHFRELAGQPVKLENMSPSIRKPNGDVYGFGYGSHKMTRSVSIAPYGNGTYDWWCRGDFGGSSVTLDYGVVSSYTTLSTRK